MTDTTHIILIVLSGVVTGLAYVVGYRTGERRLFTEAITNLYYRSAIAVAMAFFTVARKHAESEEVFAASRKLLESGVQCDANEDHQRIAYAARRLLYKLQVWEHESPIEPEEEL